MKFQDKISVIVPVYNVERYVGESIDSILAQTYDNLEIIIVNDGSTDRSGEICREYAKKYPNIKVVERENGGLSAARNSGLDVMTGEYVIFVDSDDLLPKNAIDTLYGDIISSGADFAGGAFGNFYSDRPNIIECQIKESEHQKDKSLNLSGKEAAIAMLYQNRHQINSSACGKLFKTFLWSDMRFKEGILYEDLEIIPRLTAGCASVAHTDGVVYLYRQQQASILGKMNRRRFDVLDVADSLVDFFGNDPQLVRAAKDRRMSAAFNMLLLMGRHGYDDKAVTERCRKIILEQRRDSLLNPKVRMKNKLGVILSYLLGTKAFKTRFLGKLLLTR